MPQKEGNEKDGKKAPGLPDRQGKLTRMRSIELFGGRLTAWDTAVKGQQKPEAIPKQNCLGIPIKSGTAPCCSRKKPAGNGKKGLFTVK